MLNTVGNDFVHQKFQKLLMKLGVNDLDKQLNTVSHTQTSMERCHLLYEKGKIRNEVNKLIYLKNNEVKKKEEMTECTFAPRTNSMGKIIPNKKVNFYHKTIQWKKKNDEQKDKEKIFGRKDTDDCTFHPKVNTNNMSNLFDMKNNILNDFSTRNHMLRLENMRKLEKEKKSRLVTTTKNFEIMQKRRYVRSVSADKTGFLRTGGKKNFQSSIRNLHDELHALTLER